MTIRSLLPCLLCLLLLRPSLSAQGSLTPPGGPAPTQRSLDQVEPRIPINATNTPSNGVGQFVISQPGSYVLTGNLVGVSGMVGLQIASSDVTVDLRGFTLIGVPGALAGISFSAMNRVSIMNGNVTNWPGGGIAGTGSAGARIENVSAENNQNTGILLSSNATVSGCTVRSNSGSNGMVVGGRSVISRCIAISNGQNGILSSDACVITDCVATNNGAAGILLNLGATGAANRVSGCTSSFNTGNGIECVGFGCLVEHCVVRSNGGLGISVAGDSQVSHCVASTNTLGGITATSGAHIFQNECNSHLITSTTPGITVSGAGGRIEANVCRNNGRGYVTSVTGNLVVRNHAQGNTTNYALTGTGAGPLVTAANVATNTIPHANFDF